MLKNTLTELKRTYSSSKHIAVVAEVPARTLARVAVAAVCAVPMRGTRVRRTQVHLLDKYTHMYTIVLSCIQ